MKQVMNRQMFERNQEMTKRLIVVGLLVVTMLFALSGCNKEQSQSVTETQMTQQASQAQAVEKAKELEAVKEPEPAKEPEVAKEPEAAKEPEPAKEPEAAKKLLEAEKPQPAESTKVMLRVNCGATEPYTDKAGNVWLADQSMDTDTKWGAVDGLTVDRGDLGITDTDAPKIYETERYSMEGYKFTVPNGKYTVRLHFAETYDGITAEGERVFSVSINGQTVLNDFDPFKEAGGYEKPVVKTIKDVDVTNGQLDISFTMNIQNPEINGIEIISE
jgi:hypothetical protein